MYASANKAKIRNLLLKFLGKPLQHPYCPSPKRHKNVKFRLEHHYQPAHRLSLLDSVHCARSNMTESTEDQLQSEPGGSPAQASQKVQTKPVGTAGSGCGSCAFRHPPVALHGITDSAAANSNRCRYSGVRPAGQARIGRAVASTACASCHCR